MFEYKIKPEYITIPLSDNFEVIDVRNLSHEYFSKVVTKAGELLGHKNLMVIQKYEPLSLIKFLADKGWQYKVEKLNNELYNIYFFRKNQNGIKNETRFS
ncbi:MAG: hypothetical protein CR986_02135 [Ignavibacteriae bacterium]|nr:MAG: hypothetical protein CR986_02135 [Ignavibacteriota bacterium]